MNLKYLKLLNNYWNAVSHNCVLKKLRSVPLGLARADGREKRGLEIEGYKCPRTCACKHAESERRRRWKKTRDFYAQARCRKCDDSAREGLDGVRVRVRGSEALAQAKAPEPGAVLDSHLRDRPTDRRHTLRDTPADTCRHRQKGTFASTQAKRYRGTCISLPICTH